MASFVKSSLDIPNSGGQWSGCEDVLSRENSKQRWADALQSFSSEISETDASTRGRVVMKAILDVSTSMDGNKLTAVKLGLCAVVAHLCDTDLLSISSFCQESKMLTDGFQPVSSLRSTLPALLYNLQADGCTACYDATIEGIAQVREYWAHANPTSASSGPDNSSSSMDVTPSCEQASQDGSGNIPSVVGDKHIVIVLTDGADNASTYNSQQVYRALREPGLDTFMFILVAVEMTRRDENKFRNWLELSHCKQVSVQVRTGTMLVKVFKEILMARVLQTAVGSERFYSRATGVIVRPEVSRHRHADGPVNSFSPTDGVDLDGIDMNSPQDPFDLQHNRAYSPAISMCSSCSGGDDSDDDLSMGGSYSPTPFGHHYSSDSDSDTGSDIDDVPPPMLSGPSGWRDPVLQTSGNSHSSSTHVSVPLVLDVNLSGIDIPAEMKCPITHSLMSDPVMAADGHSYDRHAIEVWLQTSVLSPLTNLPLGNNTLIPNFNLRGMIESLLEKVRKEQK